MNSGRSTTPPSSRRLEPAHNPNSWADGTSRTFDDQGNNGQVREGHVDDSAGRSHAWAEFVDDRTGKKGRSAMYERDYVYTKRMDGVSVGEVTTRVRQALAAAGSVF